MLNFIIKKIFLNIKNLYDINLNEWDNVFILTEIELLEFFNYEELNYKIIFEKEVVINRSTRDYEKCITEIINKLLELKSKDELNIRLYIIDKKIKTFISCGYNSPDVYQKRKRNGYNMMLMLENGGILPKKVNINDYKLLKYIAFTY